MDLIPNNELTFDQYDDAIIVARILLKNGYVVMLSMEEELYVLNSIWTDNCDRNGVVFMSRGEFEEVDDEHTN